MKKARQLALQPEFGVRPGFCFSRSWLNGFHGRHGIHSSEKSHLDVRVSEIVSDAGNKGGGQLQESFIQLLQGSPSPVHMPAQVCLQQLPENVLEIQEVWLGHKPSSYSRHIF